MPNQQKSKLLNTFIFLRFSQQILIIWLSSQNIMRNQLDIINNVIITWHILKFINNFTNWLAYHVFIIWKRCVLCLETIMKNYIIK